MSCPCGCCEGIGAHPPAAVANPPGLPALRYRVGTHGSILEAMLARLTTHELPPGDGEPALRPLQRLTARTADDPTIALLDGWATVADVLTFYQELIANEGFLRTATERRSLLELGRLVGYRLRPPLGATAYLAFLLGDDPSGAQGVTIAAGSRAQSVPRPGELPQSFETGDELWARASWNALRPRQEQPQRIDPPLARAMQSLELEGVVTTLATGDWLLFDFGDAEEEQIVRRIAGVKTDRATDRTTLALEHDQTFAEQVLQLAEALVRYRRFTAFGVPATAATRDLVRRLRALQAKLGPKLTPDALYVAIQTVLKAVDEFDEEGTTTAAWLGGIRGALEAADPGDEGGHTPVGEIALPPLAGGRSFDAALRGLLKPLQRPPTRPPANSARLARDPGTLYDAGSDLAPQLLAALHPELRTNLYSAIAGASVAGAPTLRAVYGLAQHVAPFGATAPRWTRMLQSGAPATHEWTIDGVGLFTGAAGGGDDTGGEDLVLGAIALAPGLEPPHSEDWVALDGAYPQLLPGDWVLVAQDPAATPMARKIKQVQNTGVAGYNMSAKVTRLELGAAWIERPDATLPLDDQPLSLLRNVTIHVAPQRLELAPQPVPAPVAGSAIALTEIADGLQSGRWLIVSGERTDVPGVAGLQGGELVMLAAARQELDPTLPGDTVHTVLELASALRYSYLRPSVTVWGNVVKATQGETHSEVLGSGDAAQPRQSFSLAQHPLTYLPAPTALGAASTLEVRVEDLRWHESDDALAIEPGERGYITATDDDDRTTVIFGAGEGGARPPSGQENIRGVYRSGAGRAGNVDRERITQLMTRPLGVRDVTNPLASTGGADRENVASARASIPLAVMALDRLVSVRDYADFARARAGIGKAGATRMSDGTRELVHVTIAGAGDAPVAPSSDLFAALREALLAQGDPHLPLRVAVRELALIAIVAGVRVQPDASWPVVEARVRAALLAELGFDGRELGQDVVLSRVIACAQAVDGVATIDVDGFALVPESLTAAQLAGLPEALTAPPPPRLRVELARRSEQAPYDLRPAQLALLSPDVPDTLILREVRP